MHVRAKTQTQTHTHIHDYTPTLMRMDTCLCQYTQTKIMTTGLQTHLARVYSTSIHNLSSAYESMHAHHHAHGLWLTLHGHAFSGQNTACVWHT